MTLKELVRQTIEREQMIRPGEQVLCALSGGADSVALVRVLLELKEDMGFSLQACHLNHHMRGEESQRDEDFVRRFCRENNLPCFVEGAQAAEYCRSHRLSPEAGARILRYDFFDRTAVRCGADRIATAHHAEDNLETMLYHLARGTGPDGLRGIPPVRDKMIRPLLWADRSQILEYLREKDQAFVEDSSNQTDQYSRNRIRHHCVPVLREINSRAEHNAMRCAGLLREELDYLEQETAKLEQKICRREDQAVILDGGFWQIAGVMQKRLLRRVLRQDFGIRPEEKHIEAVLRLEEKEASARWNLPGGVTAQRVYRNLRLSRQQPETLEKIFLRPPQKDIRLSGYTLSLSVTEKPAQVNNLFNIFYIPCDKIDFTTFCVRGRQTGDRIRLVGHTGHKTLKKLYAEKKIPQYLRAGLPVIADGNGVICIPGLGQSAERSGSCGAFLKIEFHKL